MTDFLAFLLFAFLVYVLVFWVLTMRAMWWYSNREAGIVELDEMPRWVVNGPHLFSPLEALFELLGVVD